MPFKTCLKSVVLLACLLWLTPIKPVFSRQARRRRCLTSQLPVTADACNACNAPRCVTPPFSADDHSLVPLRPVPGQRRGDYINANYIDGFLVRNQYIGAQGPLPHTFHAFWRLVWEQRVQVVVMITNLVERSRVGGDGGRGHGLGQC